MGPGGADGDPSFGLGGMNGRGQATDQAQPTTGAPPVGQAEAGKGFSDAMADMTPVNGEEATPEMLQQLDTAATSIPDADAAARDGGADSLGQTGQNAANAQRAMMASATGVTADLDGERTDGADNHAALTNIDGQSSDADDSVNKDPSTRVVKGGSTQTDGSGKADADKAHHDGVHGANTAKADRDDAAAQMDADGAHEANRRAAASRAAGNSAGQALNGSTASLSGAYVGAGDGSIGRDGGRRIGATSFDDLDPLTGQPGTTSDLSDRGSTLRTETAQPRWPTPQAEQVAMKLRAAVANGDSRFSIHLMPEELGRVDIDLEIDSDGKVRASIRAERPEALDLLSRDARHLERALHDAGFKTDQGGLEFSLAGNGSDQDSGSHAGSAFSDMLGNGGQDGRQATATASADVAAQPVAAVMGGTLPHAAADGRVDIQI